MTQQQPRVSLPERTGGVHQDLSRALLGCVEQIETVLAIFLDPGERGNDRLYDESRVGAHLRHILDHFANVLAGARGELIDYDRRTRGSAVERDPRCAQRALRVLRRELSELPQSATPVIVRTEIDCEVSRSVTVESTLERELIYLLNHSIHHLAYIKLTLVQHGFHLPDTVGLAPATASHERECRSGNPHSGAGA